LPASAYDEVADWYAESIRSGSPVHAVAMPAMIELAGEVAGLDLCDLACGTGLAARAMTARGAAVTGIDLSAGLLEIARTETAGDRETITYVQADIQRLPEVEDGAFDGAVCSLALMDIEHLDMCLSEIARILKRRRWLVFTVTHPCFQGPESRWTGKAGGTVKREVRGYFREGFWRSDNPNGVRGQVGAYHRTLGTYFNDVISAGFKIEEVREPQPHDEVAARVPGYAEVPVVLAVRCRKLD
jgi:ubiquinone/menaquinone biosynthesis C-methylase UbiE